MPNKALLVNSLMIYQFLYNMYAHVSAQYHKCYKGIVMWVYDGVIVYQSVYIPGTSGACNHVNMVNIDVNNKLLMLFTLFCKIFAYNYFHSVDEYFPIDNCVNVVAYVHDGKVHGKIDTTLASDRNAQIKNILSDPLYVMINDKINALEAYFLFKDGLVNINTMTAMMIMMNYATRFDCKHTFETVEVLNESTMEKITLKVDDLMK